MGKFDLDFTTENGNAKHVVFNNTKVEMPILSMDRWNERGHKTLLDSQDGRSFTTEKATDLEDPVINRQGVYFMKMYVHKSLAKIPVCVSYVARPGH